MAISPTDVAGNSGSQPVPQNTYNFSDEDLQLLGQSEKMFSQMGLTPPRGLDTHGRMGWTESMFSKYGNQIDSLTNSGKLDQMANEYEHKNAPFRPSVTGYATAPVIGGTAAYGAKGIPSLLNSGNSFNWKLGVPEALKDAKQGLARAGRQAGYAAKNAQFAAAGSGAADVAARNIATVAKAGMKAPVVRAGTNALKAAGNVLGAASHAIPIYDAYRAGDAMIDEYNQGFRGNYNGGGTLGKTLGVLEAGANALTLGGYDATKSAFTSGKNGQGGYGDVSGVEKDPYGAGHLGEKIGEFFFPNSHPAPRPSQSYNWGQNYQYSIHK